jgi:hypothetical protein
MLKRGSGTRKLPVYSNMNSRAARVELLKQTRNNNISAINVFENSYTPNIVSATPSPSPSPAPVEAQHAIRGTSPALAARSVRHISGAKRQTYNVRNTAQPHHTSVFGKQKLELLKMSRRGSRRGSRSTRRRRN